MSHVLGKNTNYPTSYSPDILDPVSRHLGRETISYAPASYSGTDYWTLYELSHLDESGKPRVYIGVLSYSQFSEFIIESKSLKLYLNGFNLAHLSEDEFRKTIENDVSACLKTEAKLALFPVSSLRSAEFSASPFVCVDDLPLNENVSLAAAKIAEPQFLVSHLFRSLCPVTAQPDWASVFVAINGEVGLDQQSFLPFVTSFRKHQGFHEQCVEEMISEIKRITQAESVSVFARFTRRGGIDINPFRANGVPLPEMLKLVQQSEDLTYREARQ